jgi:hypothetical protein
MQFSDSAVHAALDAIETAIGASPVLRIRTGAAPNNCAAARTGTVLATLNLPSDFMASASARSKALAGTWQDLSADAAGTAAHFEIMNNALSVCHIQGTVTATGGGGHMTLDNTNIAAAQQVTITSFTISGPAA